MSAEWVSVITGLVVMCGGLLTWIPKYVRNIVREELKSSRLHELEVENERLRKYAEQNK